MPSFYLFMTFTSAVKQMWHTYKYVLKHPFRQYKFIQTIISKCRVYIDFSFIHCTYASLNTGGIKFIKLIIVWNISNLFLHNSKDRKTSRSYAINKLQTMMFDGCHIFPFPSRLTPFLCILIYSLWHVPASFLKKQKNLLLQISPC